MTISKPFSKTGWEEGMRVLDDDVCDYSDDQISPAKIFGGRKLEKSWGSGSRVSGDPGYGERGIGTLSHRFEVGGVCIRDAAEGNDDEGRLLVSQVRTRHGIKRKRAASLDFRVSSEKRKTMVYDDSVCDKHLVSQDFPECNLRTDGFESGDSVGETEIRNSGLSCVFEVEEVGGREQAQRPCLNYLVSDEEEELTVLGKKKKKKKKRKRKRKRKKKCKKTEEKEHVVSEGTHDHQVSREEGEVEDEDDDELVVKEKQNAPSLNQRKRYASEFDHCEVSVKRKRGEGSDERLQSGDIVWANSSEEEWWPGWVLKENKLKVLVSIFGQDRFCWLSVLQVLPFDENYVEKSKNAGGQLKVAIDNALEELGKRAKLGLICLCKGLIKFNENEKSAVGGVPGYSKSSHSTLEQIIRARAEFRPLEMLGFLQKAALSVFINESDTVRANRAMAQANVYRRFVSISEEDKLDLDFCVTNEVDYSSLCSDDEYGPQVSETPEHTDMDVETNADDRKSLSDHRNKTVSSQANEFRINPQEHISVEISLPSLFETLTHLHCLALDPFYDSDGVAFAFKAFLRYREITFLNIANLKRLEVTLDRHCERSNSADPKISVSPSYVAEPGNCATILRDFKKDSFEISSTLGGRGNLKCSSFSHVPNSDMLSRSCQSMTTLASQECSSVDTKLPSLLDTLRHLRCIAQDPFSGAVCAAFVSKGLLRYRALTFLYIPNLKFSKGTLNRHFKSGKNSTRETSGVLNCHAKKDVSEVGAIPHERDKIKGVPSSAVLDHVMLSRISEQETNIAFDAVNKLMLDVQDNLSVEASVPSLCETLTHLRCFALDPFYVLENLAFVCKAFSRYRAVSSSFSNVPNSDMLSRSCQCMTTLASQDCGSVDTKVPSLIDTLTHLRCLALDPFSLAVSAAFVSKALLRYRAVAFLNITNLKFSVGTLNCHFKSSENATRETNTTLPSITEQGNGTTGDCHAKKHTFEVGTIPHERDKVEVVPSSVVPDDATQRRISEEKRKTASHAVNKLILNVQDNLSVEANVPSLCEILTHLRCLALDPFYDPENVAVICKAFLRYGVVSSSFSNFPNSDMFSRSHQHITTLPCSESGKNATRETNTVLPSVTEQGIGTTSDCHAKQHTFEVGFIPHERDKVKVVSSSVAKQHKISDQESNTASHAANKHILNLQDNLSVEANVPSLCETLTHLRCLALDPFYDADNLAVVCKAFLRYRVVSSSFSNFPNSDMLSRSHQHLTTLPCSESGKNATRETSTVLPSVTEQGIGTSSDCHAKKHTFEVGFIPHERDKVKVVPSSVVPDDARQSIISEEERNTASHAVNKLILNVQDNLSVEANVPSLWETLTHLRCLALDPFYDAENVAVVCEAFLRYRVVSSSFSNFPDSDMLNRCHQHITTLPCSESSKNATRETNKVLPSVTEQRIGTRCDCHAKKHTFEVGFIPHGTDKVKIVPSSAVPDDATQSRISEQERNTASHAVNKLILNVQDNHSVEANVPSLCEALTHLRCLALNPFYDAENLAVVCKAFLRYRVVSSSFSNFPDSDMLSRSHKHITTLPCSESGKNASRETSTVLPSVTEQRIGTSSDCHAKKHTFEVGFIPHERDKVKVVPSSAVPDGATQSRISDQESNTAFHAANELILNVQDKLSVEANVPSLCETLTHLRCLALDPFYDAENLAVVCKTFLRYRVVSSSFSNFLNSDMLSRSHQHLTTLPCSESGKNATRETSTVLPSVTEQGIGTSSDCHAKKHTFKVGFIPHEREKVKVVPSSAVPDDATQSRISDQESNTTFHAANKLILDVQDNLSVEPNVPSLCETLTHLCCLALDPFYDPENVAVVCKAFLRYRAVSFKLKSLKDTYNHHCTLSNNAAQEIVMVTSASISGPEDGNSIFYHDKKNVGIGSVPLGRAEVRSISSSAVRSEKDQHSCKSQQTQNPVSVVKHMEHLSFSSESTAPSATSGAGLLSKTHQQLDKVTPDKSSTADHGDANSRGGLTVKASAKQHHFDVYPGSIAQRQYIGSSLAASLGKILMFLRCLACDLSYGGSNLDIVKQAFLRYRVASYHKNSVEYRPGLCNSLEQSDSGSLLTKSWPNHTAAIAMPGDSQSAATDRIPDISMTIENRGENSDGGLPMRMATDQHDLDDANEICNSISIAQGQSCSSSVTTLLGEMYLSLRCLACDPFFGGEHSISAKRAFLRYRVASYEKIYIASAVKYMHGMSNNHKRFVSRSLSETWPNRRAITDRVPDDSHKRNVAPANDTNSENQFSSTSTSANPQTDGSGCAQNVNVIRETTSHTGLSKYSGSSFPRQRKSDEIPAADPLHKLKKPCGAVLPSNWYASPLTRDGLSRSIDYVQVSARSPTESTKTERFSISPESHEVGSYLHMKFPKNFELPSQDQLMKTFRRFGPIDCLKTRVFFYTGSGQVCFQRHADAEAAFKFAREKVLFGQASIKFWVSRPAKSTHTVQGYNRTDSVGKPKSGESGNDDQSLCRGKQQLKDYDYTNRTQSSPISHVKSCLRNLSQPGEKDRPKSSKVTFSVDRQSCLPAESIMSPLTLPSNHSLRKESGIYQQKVSYLLKDCKQLIDNIRGSMGLESYYEMLIRELRSSSRKPDE